MLPSFFDMSGEQRANTLTFGSSAHVATKVHGGFPIPPIIQVVESRTVSLHIHGGTSVVQQIGSKGKA